MLLIFQKSERTNVLSLFIVSGRAKDFKCLFRKIRHHFFVESDEFSGEQMTGPEKPLFFVYAAQVLHRKASPCTFQIYPL